MLYYARIFHYFHPLGRPFIFLSADRTSFPFALLFGLLVVLFHPLPVFAIVFKFHLLLLKNKNPRSISTSGVLCVILY